MVHSQFKISYLTCVLPALFFCACNGSGGSTSTSATPNILFSTTGLGTNESIAVGGEFVVIALLSPYGAAIGDQIIESLSINKNGNFYNGGGVIFGPPSSCTVSSVLGNESCQITVKLDNNLESGSYSLLMQDSSSNILLLGQDIRFNVVARQPCNPCSMFTVGHNGNYGGIFGADNLCQVTSDSVNVPKGQYKAFITLGGGESQGVNRYACSESYCAGQNNTQFDWVLYPNTQYIDESGTLQFQTNESSIITESAIQPQWPSGTKPRIRTGINKNWTSPSASSNLNCSGWTGSGGASYSIVGFLHNSTHTPEISKIHNASYTTSNCGAGIGGPDVLLCVQQF